MSSTPTGSSSQVPGSPRRPSASPILDTIYDVEQDSDVVITNTDDNIEKGKGKAQVSDADTALDKHPVYTQEQIDLAKKGHIYSATLKQAERVPKPTRVRFPSNRLLAMLQNSRRNILVSVSL